MHAILRVTCAIIMADDKILCAQRGKNMSHPLQWEFPGGKVEIAESDEACIKREILEELNLQIEVQDSLQTTRHKYSEEKEIELIPFICSYIDGELKLKEHQEVRWLAFCELQNLNWTEADLPIVDELVKKYCNNKG
ncbi:(deoxy)nucleoside triphosphate pyrophosphohydrolase [Belliella sp. R4-6]|uniref:8-oxo-dGTP diphosphatase n=1 Tax=Belliella alkalica TaxID=1730871 RepID=A0ABS9VDG2_9BACT|nr:(deoxy)nucleoside triphosphate pyrophosphohydrolase [Belliella alkalica]MCH7414462.1 (deoxy)nucleoside triphosphate pyrophosphohydrolase [Belliella alkalica]